MLVVELFSLFCYLLYFKCQMFHGHPLIIVYNVLGASNIYIYTHLFPLLELGSTISSTVDAVFIFVQLG